MKKDAQERKSKENIDANKELIAALDMLEKEKEISKEVMFEAIETSLLAACKNQFGKADNIKVNISRTTGEIKVIAQKAVVEEVTDPALEISLDDAAALYPTEEIKVGDEVNIDVTPKDFYRISAQKAKQTVVQKIREEERRILYMQYIGIEHEVVTGTVQRYVGNNVSINLGKVDALLTENEQSALFRARGSRFMLQRSRTTPAAPGSRFQELTGIL